MVDDGCVFYKSVGLGNKIDHASVEEHIPKNIWAENTGLDEEILHKVGW